MLTCTRCPTSIEDRINNEVIHHVKCHAIRVIAYELFRTGL